jgi:diguanylate cyclase (GGDEF)-like protein
MIPELSGDLVRCLRERQPLRIRSAPDNDRVLGILGVEEAAAVPVMTQGRLVGLLWLHGGQRLEVGRLGEVLLVANELGIALEHSRIFREERERAQLDGLTRLQNRATIDRFLPESFREAVSGGRPFSLGLVDIDHFKGFNDRFGHQAGDDVLRIVADCMRRLTRPRDLVGRYGGEEFLFILLDTDGNGAQHYAERIRAGIESQGRVVRDRFPGHALTASIGIAARDPEYPTASALVAAADRALYRAKATGRNRVVAAWELGDPPLRLSEAG